MKKVLLASVAVAALLIAQPTYAADMAVKPILKAPPMAPVFSWTGCFVGGQVGWGWQRSHINQTGTSSSTSFVAASSGSVDANGPVFGGQVGCDYQVGNSFVIGAQGTFLAADIDGVGQDPMNGVAGSGGSIGVNSSSIYSATGRVGFTGLMPQTMFYVRGGAAWMKTQYDLRDADLNYFGVNAPLFDVTHQGWTIGGGVEWMFATSWSAFAEYNFYRFDSQTIMVSQGVGNVNTFTSQPDVSTVTVGLNFHFGMH
jgi:outer membrane immunogenic protein